MNTTKTRSLSSLGLRRGLLFGVVAIAAQIVTPAAGEFAGWQGLRVVEQEGYPLRMRAADLDNNGTDELIIVNYRNARLDLYGWNSEGVADHHDNNEGAALSEVSASRHVNDLPLAPEFKVTEVPVRQPPLDVAVWPAASGIPGSATASLLIVVADPNRLLQFDLNNNGAWALSQQWDLLAGRLTGSGRLLQLTQDAEGRATVFLSFNEGIQHLTIDRKSDPAQRSTARWLEPRESLGRYDWWLADLDRDGREDLIEWTSNAQQTLRWYARTEQGFRPAQPLHDQTINMATVLERPQAEAELLILESNPAGMVRRYRLSEGESSLLGQREPLALAGGEDAVWTTLAINETTHLAVADPNQPRLTLYGHHASGWSAGESYPVSGKIEMMASLPEEPGSLLLWPKDGGDLFASNWDGSRLTFPRPIGLADGVEDSAILGMGQDTDHVWCVQKLGNDLLLHRLRSAEGKSEDGSSANTVTRFVDTAGKAERATVVGKERLLVADKFAKGLRLVTLAEDTTQPAVSVKPSSLSRASLDEFRLYRASASLPSTIGRLTNGVVQWLDDELTATDQVMLSDGRRIADLVLLPDGSAWALEQGGAAIHLLTPDEGGVLRIDQSTRFNGGGRSLILDGSLGLLLRTSQGVTRLAEGQPLELGVVQSLDSRVGRPQGVRDATVHRVMKIDIDGDGNDDALLADDLRHQLTALSLNGDDQLSSLLSWPVFEDLTYPYGGTGEEQVREPRSVVALDLDGDDRQDLALLSHDRLLIYLAQEPQTEGSTQ